MKKKQQAALRGKGSNSQLERTELSKSQEMNDSLLQSNDASLMLDNSGYFNQSIMLGPETEEIKEWLSKRMERVAISSANSNEVEEKLDSYVHGTTQAILDKPNKKNYFENLLNQHSDSDHLFNIGQIAQPLAMIQDEISAQIISYSPLQYKLAGFANIAFTTKEANNQVWEEIKALKYEFKQDKEVVKQIQQIQHIKDVYDPKAVNYIDDIHFWENSIDARNITDKDYHKYRDLVQRVNAKKARKNVSKWMREWRELDPTKKYDDAKMQEEDKKRKQKEFQKIKESMNQKKEEHEEEVQKIHQDRENKKKQIQMKQQEWEKKYKNQYDSYLLSGSQKLKSFKILNPVEQDREERKREIAELKELPMHLDQLQEHREHHDQLMQKKKKEHDTNFKKNLNQSLNYYSNQNLVSKIIEQDQQQKHQKELKLDKYYRRIEYSEKVKKNKKPAMDPKNIELTKKTMLKLSKSVDILKFRLDKGDKQKKSGYENLEKSRFIGRKVVDKLNDSSILLKRSQIMPQPKEKFDRLPPVGREHLNYLSEYKKQHQDQLEQDYGAVEKPMKHWENILQGSDLKSPKAYNLQYIETGIDESIHSKAFKNINSSYMKKEKVSRSAVKLYPPIEYKRKVKKDDPKDPKSKNNNKDKNEEEEKIAPRNIREEMKKAEEKEAKKLAKYDPDMHSKSNVTLKRFGPNKKYFSESRWDKPDDKGKKIPQKDFQGMYAHVKKLEEESAWNYKDAKNTPSINPEKEKERLKKLQKSDNYLINSVNAKYALVNRTLIQKPVGKKAKAGAKGEGKENLEDDKNDKNDKNENNNKNDKNDKNDKGKNNQGKEDENF